MRIQMIVSGSARRILAMAAIGTAVLPASAVQATTPTGFSAVQQWKGLYEELDVKGDKTGKWDLTLTTKDKSDVHVVRNAIAVGGQSGWHTHPGPSLITVTVGQITVYDGDNPLCTSKVIRAGEGSIDMGGGHTHLLRNESGAPAETVAVQFLPEGSDRRIDRPKPTNCPF